MIPFSRRALKSPDIPAPAAILLALILSLVTSGALYLLSQFEHVNNTTIALVYLLPVGFSATLWGLIPGATAAVISFIGFNYLFIPEQYTLRVKETEDLVVLFAFLVVAVVISELVSRVRGNLAEATAREYEALSLYELSNLLARAQDERAIAQALMEKVDESLRPERIEVLIESRPAPVLLTTGESLTESTSVKPLVVPLQTARGLAGEIRVWNRARTIKESGDRLLNIFASQGVLSLERLRFAETARKTLILEESDRLKSSLLSSVSHELRSPLAAIKASVSSLRSGEIDWNSEARMDLLITVEEEIDHLNILVGNLLDMSRIEAGALNPAKKPNMLREIVNVVTERMKQQTHDYRIEVNVPDELPLVNVDFVQMQQVFTNLLTNSLKYSAPGSTIWITARPTHNRQMLVTVTNQSMPIPEDDLERIFDKFHRINPSERTTGSGLGLSICKGIVEAHAGKIWAENVPGGVAFNFTIPI
jgi:two-component system, OmpR family, sensor histidine kinase KdpD